MHRASLGDGTFGAKDHLALAQLAAAVGDAGVARDHVASALQLGVDDPIAAMYLAQVYASLGERERALREVTRALETGYPYPYLPLVLPALRPLRDDPRFLGLFGLPDTGARRTE